jgi:CBS domain-containing protein
MAEAEATVSQFMDSTVNVVEMDTNVRDCAKEMAKKKAGYAVVVKNGTAMGIVTERDFVQKVIGDGLNPAKVLIRDIMSTPLITIAPSAAMTEAAKLMSEYKVRRLVVVDDEGNLAGIVAATDLARTLAEKKGFSDPTLNAIARLESPTGGPYQ